MYWYILTFSVAALSIGIATSFHDLLRHFLTKLSVALRSVARPSRINIFHIFNMILILSISSLEIMC